MNSSANVVQVPEYVTVFIVFFIIALVVICAVLQKKKQKKEVEAEARAKELAQLQFNQSLEQHIENFTQNGLPQIKVDRLQLTKGEVCHFYSEATHCKIKNRVVGYEGGYRGRSIRIVKGWSIRTGSTAKQAVRANVEFTTEGHLYITNKRIIFIAPANSKTVNINSIISLNNYNQYAVILDNKEENMFAVPDQALLLGILRVLLNQL
ncbi:MAG: hypothetical protein KIG16_00255 [Eubacteriales bacterium]|nr:hypothetical protein [Eubacteriales bacterium]